MSNLPKRNPLAPDRGGRPLPSRGVRPQKLQEGQTDADKMKSVPVDPDLAEATDGQRLVIRDGEIVATDPAEGGGLDLTHIQALPHFHDILSDEHTDTYAADTEEHLDVMTWVETLGVAYNTYTGDGTASKAITGLGFTPKLVVIKDATGTEKAAAVKSDTMSDTRAIAFGNGSSGIASLDADGFTVAYSAADAFNTNENTATYYWYAFGGDNVDTGTYVGTGASLGVTGVGWQPVMVWILPRTTGDEACFKTSLMGGANSITFGTADAETDKITALDADGFTVGTDGMVNTAAATHHYVAFRASDNLALFAYSGDGVDGRDLPEIPMTFDPAVVHIKGTDAGGGLNAVFKTLSLAGDAALPYGVAGASADVIQTLTPASGQFEVGTNATTNTLTYTYYGFAAGAGGGRWEARPASAHGTHGGAGSGTMTTVKEGGVQVGGSDIVTLDFGTGFDITESPDTEINVALDLSEISAGGELGGTMDAPTVDANHGGTHAIGQGGTGQTTAQAAIDALTQVSGATNEHVLTKDTATGNAIFKAAAGGGHAILDGGAVHTDAASDTVTKGSLIVGNTTPAWDELVVGTDGQVLTADAAQAMGVKWSSTGPAHPLLGSPHNDVTISTVVRGDLVYGDSAPSWNNLPLNSTAGAYLRSNGLDPAWATILNMPISAKTIASDQISVTAGTTTSLLTLAGEGGVADDLDGITGGTQGDILFLSAVSDSVTITIKHNNAGGSSGAKIFTAGATDITLDDIQDLCVMVYKTALDGGNGGWMAALLSGGGAGGAHDLLDGATHNSTTASTPTRGDIIYANSSPAWDDLALGLAAQYLRSDGTDIAYANPVIKGELTNLTTGSDKWVYRLSRATGLTFTTLEITCDTAPVTESHVFTFNKNGSSVGTVTLATSSTRNTSTVSAFDFAAGNKLSVDHTSASCNGGSGHTTNEGGRITAAIY